MIPRYKTYSDLNPQTWSQTMETPLQNPECELLADLFRSGERSIGSANCCGAHTQLTPDPAPTEAFPFHLFDLVLAKNSSRSAYRLAGFGTVLTRILKTGNHTLANDGALEFRHRRENGEHRAPHRGRGIQRFLVGDKIDSQGTELLQRQYQLLHAPSESVKPPNHDYIHGSTPGIPHEGVKAWTSFFGTTRSVGIDAERSPTALPNQVAERLLLDSRVLIECESITPPRPTGSTHA